MPLDPAPIQDMTVTTANRFFQTWILWFRKLVTRVNNTQGWAYYQDSTYTSGSPLSVLAGVRTQITIDKLGTSTRDDFMFNGEPLWDGTKITPSVAGDSYMCRLDFVANPVGNNQYIDIELQIDTGNIIYSDTIPLLKGAANNMHFGLPIPFYVGNTFKANGGKIYFTPSGNTSFYNLGIFISRVGTP